MIEIKVDPRLSIPEVIGVTYDEYGNPKTPGSDGQATDPLDLGDAVLPPIIIDEDTPPDGVVLAPPESVVLVQEIIRVNSDGKTVIDAVLEIGDVVGAVEYEHREAIS